MANDKPIEQGRDEKDRVVGGGRGEAGDDRYEWGEDGQPAEEGVMPSQSGGTRGSSNQGGPDRSGEPRKDNATRMNSRDDRGSRSTLGEDWPRGTEDTIGRQDEAPRGPLPEGARREDYVGGERPHETRQPRTPGASGGRNDVL